MQIKTVALLGAGAVGAYFIWGLAEKMGDDFCVIAKGDRKERLEKEGLIINGKQYVLNVKTPEKVKNVDLLLVSSKQDGLVEALDDIKSMVGDKTIVLSLLNGVKSEEFTPFQGVKPMARFSTLQDLDAKRHTEIEMLAGEMIRMGMEHGIAVPYCEYTYHLIKALEEKNDGKLAY